jgi:muramoyltetrapeptide carboxypeptidase
MRDFSASNAVLWGGNLSVLCTLLGTPFWPKVTSGVLFLEDIAEHPYRIERLLTQLLQSGVLARQKALVLGQFTGYELGSHDRGFSLKTVVQWLQSKLTIPVLTNLPFGHVQTKVLLPVGAKVDLVVEGRDVLIAWGHID